MNWLAICEQNNSVFYFGGDELIFENGKALSSEEESWHAGVDHAKAGVFIPSIMLLGARCQEETAPDEAMYTGRIISLDEKIHTSDVNFDDVLRVRDHGA